ncbi:hypothetical protein QFC21_004675 [Naganishia friedmannii]|uniref:Uncharacterized protein n=1 Tax=Naganishia friedmannii TaxID=89922 RepID=A0ACC2VEP8_9TREE|nr:hypothetical protein QFC21_004675 [Naganishia friedmannii]
MLMSLRRFIPKAVFGVPDTFYKENTVTSVADATTPLARVNDQNPNIALVPLNLFILTEKPLSINVSFDLSQNMEHVVWQRAISAAFLHPEVQNRLQSIRKLYVGPSLKDNDPKGNKFKAMAIFEMLTGLSADLTEKNCPQSGSTPEGDCTPLFEKLGEKEDNNMDWSWLYKDFVEMSRDKTLVYPPTVLFSSDGKLRSVTIPNSEDLFILNLEDPAKPEEDKDAHGNPNEHPLKQVEEMLVWAVRQKDLSVPLDSTTTRETVQKKALTQSAYYQNGPWEPLSTSES